MEKIRVQKWFSNHGLASRREAENLICARRITINGQLARLGDHVIDQDKISLDGRLLSGKEKPPLVYWMLYKPDYILCSRKKELGKKTLYDLKGLENNPYLVFPVGRLDYRSQGLLLLTNDGELCLRLLHPKYQAKRSYQVYIKGKLSEDELKQVRAGIKLADGKASCEIDFVSQKKLGNGQQGSWYQVKVTEGRNRLVRKLFAHFKYEVITLVRYAHGSLTLDPELMPGKYRQLSRDEILALKKSVGL